MATLQQTAAENKQFLMLTELIINDKLLYVRTKLKIECEL